VDDIVSPHNSVARFLIKVTKFNLATRGVTEKTVTQRACILIQIELVA
jgi:hypothetical protein